MTLSIFSLFKWIKWYQFVRTIKTPWRSNPELDSGSLSMEKVINILFFTG